MRPEKFGIAIDQGLAYRILEISGTVHKNRNAVIVRVLQIGLEALAPFEGKALATVIKDPWELARQLPALRRQMEKRSHGLLVAPTATRLTMREKIALRTFAEKNNTTMSGIQRTALQRILATSPESR